MEFEQLNLNHRFTLYGFKSLADAVIFSSKINEKKRIIFTLTGKKMLETEEKIVPGDFVITLDKSKGYVLHIDSKNNTQVVIRNTDQVKSFPVRELQKNKRSYQDWAKLLGTKPEYIGRMAYEWPFLVCINTGTELHWRDHFNSVAWE